MAITDETTMIDFKQASTKRGMIWIVTAILGYIGWWSGKDITPIILIGTTVAGGLGVAIDDKEGK